MSSRADPSDPEAQRDQNPSAKNEATRLRSTPWRRTAQTSGRSVNMPSMKRRTVAENPSHHVHLQVIELLFGPGYPYAQNWPGILVIFSRLEIQFKVLLRDDFNVIWKILSREKPTEAHECWHWCLAVLQEFQSLQANQNISMETAYKHLINDRLVELTDSEKDPILLAIFAVLCWTSMTLVPILEPEQTMETNLCLSFRAKGLKTVKLSQTSLESTAKRPIIKLFGILKSLIKDHDGVHAGSAATDTDTIHESSVNFLSLHTIGRVRIKWVEDLTSHLAFDRQSRTISVFCLPTFCVCSILRTQQVQILQQVSSELFPSILHADHSDQDKSPLHREVLLTYRLLFGQSSQSRGLAVNLLERLKVSSGDIDPFLSIVCTASTTRSRFLRRFANPELPADLFPTAILDINNYLIDSDTYSARDDFPHFGSRLLTLQQYNLRQQPSRVRDLWRDRRNPLQWYTFWAVLWVGGITIGLGILQLATGIVQIYYSAHGH